MLLSERNPVLRFDEDGQIVYMKNGTFAIGIEIDLPQIFTLGHEGYQDMAVLWNKVFSTLPEETIMHKQDMFFLKNWKMGVKATDHPLVQDNLKLMNGRHFMDHKCLVFFVKVPSFIEQKEKSGAMQDLKDLFVSSKKLKQTSVADEEIKSFSNSILSIEETVNETLKKMGGSCRILNTDDYLGTEANLYQGIMFDYLFMGFQAASDIEFKESKALVSGGHLRSISVDTLTAFLGKSISPLQTERTMGIDLSLFYKFGLFLPFNHVCNSYLYKTDQKKTKRRFEVKRNSVNMFSNISSVNKSIASNIEKFLESVEENKQTICFSHFNIFFQAPSEEFLDRFTNKIKSQFVDLGIRPVINTVDLPQLFWAGFPGNAAEIKPYNYMTMTLDAALCLMINETAAKDTVQNGVPETFKLTDRLYGRPLEVDLNNKPYNTGAINNYNMAVFGPSGSGKSVYTNLMLFYALINKDAVIILDKGGSYDNLIDIFGGNYYVYSDDKSFSFNPFYIRSMDEVNTRRQSFLRNIIFSLYFDKDEDFESKVYIAFFDSVIYQYYKAYFETPSKWPLCFDSFYLFVLEKLNSSNDEYIKKEINVNRWEYVMMRFSKAGQFPYLLNSDEEKDLLNEQLCVFETNGISENKELYQIVTLIITNLYVDKIMAMGDNPDKYTYFVFEEAWDVLGNAKYAAFFKWVFKTSRKHKGKPVIVTQELSDLFENPEVGRTILVNCPTIVLLDLRDYKKEINKVIDLLSLNEKDTSLLKTLNLFLPDLNINKRGRRKEVWIKQGQQPANAYAVEITKKMFWAFNTNKEDKFLVHQLKQRLGNDVMKALDVISEVPEEEISKYKGRVKILNESEDSNAIKGETQKFINQIAEKYGQHFI